MKIGFHTNGLSFRGAEIAVFDYAFHNQALLKNDSIIFYKASSKSELEVVEKFKQHFKIIPYESIDQLSKLSEQENLDLMYFIKSGERDGDTVSYTHLTLPTKRIV